MTFVLQSASMRRLRRAAAGGLLAIVLVGSCGVSHALAEDDDDDDLTFEQRILKNILGGVGSGPTGAGIDYRERSPLVIPPSRQLPAPGAPITATPGSNWPTDPDQNRKKTKAAVAKKGKNAQEALHAYDPGRALTPAELNRGGPGGGRVTQRGDSPSAAEDGGRALPPSLLGYTGGLFGSLWNPGKPETATFSHEPPRTSLTEPPVGYQTPSPVYPYGINTPKGGPVNRDIETRKKDPAVGNSN